MIWQALSGGTRSLRRQCHVLLASPMAPSTVDRNKGWDYNVPIALSAFTFRDKLWTELHCAGYYNSVPFDSLDEGLEWEASTSRHMYPLYPSNTPLIGLFGPSKASKRSDSLNTRESWALPGWRATTLINNNLWSHATWNQKQSVLINVCVCRPIVWISFTYIYFLLVLLKAYSPVNCTGSITSGLLQNMHIT